MLNELLIKLGEQIKATQFFAAVGFSFSSGLRLVKPLMDQVRSNNGKIELVVGALQLTDLVERIQRLIGIV